MGFSGPQNVRFFLIISFLAFITVFPGSISAFTLVKNGQPACSVILAGKATPAEQRAAEELVSTIERISGARIPIISEGEHTEKGNYIFLGRGAWLSLPRFRPCVETLEVVGKQGFVIEPVWNGGFESLAVAGGSPGAMMHAVHELLRRAGERWYTADFARIPRHKTIEFVSKQTADFPCFKYRGIVPGEGEASSGWKERLRLNAGEGIPLDRSGTGMEYIPLEVPLRDLLPKALFASHQEYFPLIEGGRTDAFDLCCFTRPEAAALAAAGIVARLEQMPEVTHVILRFDSPGAICRCPGCEQLAKREGESGLALSWLNTVSEQVARAHRSAFLVFSEPWTIGPAPKTIQPRENVAVLLDSGGYLGSQAFDRAVKQWTGLTGKILLGLPFIPKDGEPIPFRGLDELAENIVRYRDSDVEGIIFRSPSSGLLTADTELRMWALSELLWNADLDADTLMLEWLKGACGSAASPLREYYTHIRTLSGKKPGSGTIASAGIDDRWLDTADRMLQRAFALSLTDRAANRQVRRMRLGLSYLRLCQVYESARNGAPPESAARDKYLDMLDKFVLDSREFSFERVSRAEMIGDFTRRIRATLGEGYRSRR